MARHSGKRPTSLPFRTRWGERGECPNKGPKDLCHAATSHAVVPLFSLQSHGWADVQENSRGQFRAKIGRHAGPGCRLPAWGRPPPQVGWTTHHTFPSWAHTPAPNHLPHMDCSPPPRGTNARHRSPVAPLPKPPATKGTPGGGTLPQGRVGGGQLACLRAPPGGGLAFPPQPPTDRLRCVAPHWPLISLVGFDGASQARQSHARR